MARELAVTAELVVRPRGRLAAAGMVRDPDAAAASRGRLDDEPATMLSPWLWVECP